MKSIARIVKATRELWSYFIGIIICAVLTSATSLLAPFIISGATDTVVNHLNGSAPTTGATIAWFAVAYLVAQLVSVLTTNIGGYIGDVMSQRMRTILSVRYYEKLLSLPLSYFDTELTGTIIARLNRSITEVTNFVKTMSNTFISLVLTTVSVIAISSLYYWPLGLLLIVIFPVYFWLTSKTSEKWQVWEGEKNENIDIASGRFAEVIGQIRVVKSFGRERRELSDFGGRFEKTIGLTRAQSKFWHSMDVARLSFLNLIFFALYLLIFLRTLAGDFSIGDMVLLIQLLAMAVAPINSLSWIVDTAQRAIAGSKDYFEVMERQSDARALAITAGAAGARPALTSREVANQLSAEPGDELVRFEGVTFGYEGEADVLHGIDLSVQRGERIAFVGESGGGKSTLMALLEGLYDPREGRVLVDSMDIAGSDLAKVRSLIGMVFQDASLFSGTIAENIAYGRPDATREQIIEAATRANAHDFISKFADGYESLIGERGLKLSGGQKQRIAIARAMLKDAPILILDEATSALDTKAERAVQKGLEELMEGRTSLIIAHRLSTIATVDRIVTLKEGRIDEVGSPAELAASGGIYAELLGLQTEGGKASKKKLQSFDIVG
ncbi:MAG: ABC transporter ATP-binding protein [Rothia sp. (in: high G+C Gram-positive bacteria)]|uniref:ABC transporter ATP-binding protein n=1 Tax=Rothia sp. (in: high G+C Gram-positive bacteria) TaxID=1885016 RepID=UPI0026FF9135|nr:ABC transporter ATP-binding protein [Rothia sp. (in: high G+C Gram-positive bacteria)]